MSELPKSPYVVRSQSDPVARSEGATSDFAVLNAGLDVHGLFDVLQVDPDGTVWGQHEASGFWYVVMDGEQE